MRLRWVMLGAALAALAALSIFGAMALAGPSADVAAQRLTGGGGKEWILVRFETFLGSEAKCKRGEIWRFKARGQLEITKCVNGKAVHQAKTWQLLRKNPLDLALVVDGREFTILLPPPKSGSDIEEMHLRVIAKEKTTPTVDLRFTHERD